MILILPRMPLVAVSVRKVVSWPDAGLVGCPSVQNFVTIISFVGFRQSLAKTGNHVPLLGSDFDFCAQLLAETWTLAYLRLIHKYKVSILPKFVMLINRIRKITEKFGGDMFSRCKNREYYRKVGRGTYTSKTKPFSVYTAAWCPYIFKCVKFSISIYSNVQWNMIDIMENVSEISVNLIYTWKVQHKLKSQKIKPKFQVKWWLLK